MADTDIALTDAQQVTLKLVLNMIIPPSADGRMPGAADVDVQGYIQSYEKQYLDSLAAELDRLESEGFSSLSAVDQTALVDQLRSDEPQFLAALAMHTAAAYYMDDRVVVALGMEARPPFPKGYEVLSGDLTLLDPVKARGQIWRDTQD